MAENESSQSWFISFHSTSNNFSYLWEFDGDALKRRFTDMFGKTVKLTAQMLKNKNGGGHQFIIGDIELESLTEKSANIEEVTASNNPHQKNNRPRKRIKPLNTNEATPSKQSRN